MPGYFVDTNVWIACFFQGHPHHAIATAFMRERSANAPANLARLIEISVLRLLTTASICRCYDAPVITNPCAVEILEGWRSLSHILLIDREPEGTRDLWLELAAIPSASPKVWMDAYLAAFAIRADLPLATLDHDFRRFEANGLRLHLLTD